MTRCLARLPLAAYILAFACSWYSVCSAADGPTITPSRSPAVRQLEDDWQVVYLGNQRAGYGRLSSRLLRVDGRDVVRSEMEIKFAVKRFGQSVKMETLLEIDETPEGEWIGYSYEVRNPPAAPTRTIGRIDGTKLKLELVKGGIRSSDVLNWDSDVQPPTYQERLLREWKPKPGETKSFKTFLPELNIVSSVKLVADDFRMVKLPDGTERKLLKLNVTQSVLPQIPVRAYVDESGIVWMTTTEIFGMTQTTQKVNAAEALKDVASGDIDIAVSALVKVKPIPQGHASKRAVYRVTIQGEDPTRLLTSGNSQSIKPIAPDTAEVTVSAIPVPASSRTSGNGPGPEYLQPSPLIQSDDRGVVDHANRAAAGLTDPAQIARSMEKYVRENLKKRNMSTVLASAAEVAKSLEGDCTEHAVLLAAMLRAQRIPSRIVTGLVYIENLSSFCGHMWTEAWLGGQWVPLDATLGRGGIGAAHLKMGESSFSEKAVAPVAVFLPMLRALGRIKIDVVESN